LNNSTPLLFLRHHERHERHMTTVDDEGIVEDAFILEQVLLIAGLQSRPTKPAAKPKHPRRHQATCKATAAADKLWTVSAVRVHADFMMANGFQIVAAKVLMDSNPERFTQLLLGILANILSHNTKSVEALLDDSVLPNLLARIYLSVSDPSVLQQCLRIMACIATKGGCEWLRFCTSTAAWDRLLFIIDNSFETALLHQGWNTTLCLIYHHPDLIQHKWDPFEKLKNLEKLQRSLCGQVQSLCDDGTDSLDCALRAVELLFAATCKDKKSQRMHQTWRVLCKEIDFVCR